MSPWLTALELQDYLKVSKSFVYKSTMRGTIPLHRVGSRVLFHRDEIDAWVRSRAASTGPSLSRFEAVKNELDSIRSLTTRNDTAMPTASRNKGRMMA